MDTKRDKITSNYIFGRRLQLAFKVKGAFYVWLTELLVKSMDLPLSAI